MFLQKVHSTTYADAPSLSLCNSALGKKDSELLLWA